MGSVRFQCKGAASSHRGDMKSGSTKLGPAYAGTARFLPPSRPGRDSQKPLVAKATASKLSAWGGCGGREVPRPDRIGTRTKRSSLLLLGITR